MFEKEVIQLNFELVGADLLLVALVLVAKFEDKGEDVVSASDCGALGFINSCIEISDAFFDFIKSITIDENLGGGRVEDSLPVWSSLVYGVSGSNLFEISDSQLPCVLTIFVGDGESDQGLSEVVLDLTEEDLVDLSVGGEEEGERLVLGLDRISQSSLEVLLLFISWDLETDNSVNEILVWVCDTESVELELRGFFSINFQTLLSV